MSKYAILFILCASQTSFAWETPEKAVSSLVDYDLNGGRLGSAGWKKYVNPFLYAPDHYDEPGWDQVVVVNSYKILSKNCNSNKCNIEIEFDLYPTNDLKGLPVIDHPNGGKEVLVMVAQSRNGEWRVVPANDANKAYRPHVLLSKIQK